MKILVTAGNTQVPIDRVRCLTNVFTGRTGARMALFCQARGHDVSLLTSHPEVIEQLKPEGQDLNHNWQVLPYQTFEELRRRLGESMCISSVDAVIHSAAVGDYLFAGAYTPAPKTRFDNEKLIWTNAGATPAALIDMGQDKIKSSSPELWLRLQPAPKLIDMMRNDWGFRGVLVKFKLEAGIADGLLIDVAERSRVHSAADLMVANTLDGAADWAFLGPLAGEYKRIPRSELPAVLLYEIERLHKENTR